MLFPPALQNAAQAAIQYKENLIVDVLSRLDIIKDGEPHDMNAISRRCRFVVHRESHPDYPNGTEIFEVDRVPRLAIYPHTCELERRGESYFYVIRQQHRFL